MSVRFRINEALALEYLLQQDYREVTIAAALIVDIGKPERSHGDRS
jgi:hypothetical protein